MEYTLKVMATQTRTMAINITINTTRGIYAPPPSISKSRVDDDVGQGKLYAPQYAIRVDKNDTSTTITTPPSGSNITQEATKNHQTTTSMGVATDIRRNFVTIKERLIEKLAVAAVPADALDNARHFLETVVRDVTVAAQGLTKDALNRIKTQLVDLLPSLSPTITRKMVDDADKEANEGKEEIGDDQEQKSSDKSPLVSRL